MKYLTKHIYLTLALILPTASLAYDFEVDGIYYNIYGNIVSVTDADGNRETPNYSGDVIIPATVTYNGTTYSVTSIDRFAFYHCVELSSIDIPNSVTFLGESAFENCTRLTIFDIPNSVTRIDDYAFTRCSSLTNVNIGNSVKTIGYGAFSGCSSLAIIFIPNSVTYIGNFAFSGCSSLTSINIPNSVTSINDATFDGCSSLTNVNIGNSVTTIGYEAFYGCPSLMSVTIPNSVTTIKGYAFSDCKGLTSIFWGDSVTYIGEGAFSGCRALTSATIPNSVISIGDHAFSGCGLTSVTIPNSVTSIGDGVFTRCNELTSITVENENPTYDSRYGCNAIIETNTNTLISGCKNTIIPNTVTTIGSYAFNECVELTNIDIPYSVTSISKYAFCWCIGLASVTIPNSVTSIDSAFYGCVKLTTVFLTGNGEWTAGELPNTLKTLYIDSGITGVQGMKQKPTNVYSFAVTPPTCDDNSFTDYSGNLHVPAASLAAYFTAPYWCNFANIIGNAVKPDGLTLDTDSLELIVPEMTTLAANISPVTATSNIVTWASSNPNVATIAYGKVTAVGYGECDIVATCLDHKAVCHVTVYNDRLSINPQEAHVLPNHIVAFTPTSLAGELPALTVTSSDPTVAAARVMNGKVQVVGITEGTVTITVASADGYAKPTTCLVTVYTELGDVNCDGFVNVTDVTTLIDKILGNEVTTFKDSNADLNGDNNLNVTDVTTLIRKILDN